LRFPSPSTVRARCTGGASPSSFRFRGAGNFRTSQWSPGLLSGGRRLRTVLAKAGSEPEWYSANIKTKSKVGNDRYKFVLDVGQDVAKGYTLAGQFVQVTTDSNDESKKPAYIALANTPSAAGQDGMVEMVIKTNDGTAGAICDLGEGADLDVSAVMGKGFNFADRAPLATCKNVYLIATGTGISPIRALINSGELDIPKRDSVVLYYGYRNSEYCAYSEEIESWEKLGIKVVPVLSEPESGWQGAKGYVQDSFKTAEKVDESTVAVIAGQYEIPGIIQEIFKEANVPEDRVLLNF
jgi:NAD(P)H-flavin reductase